MAEEGEVMFKTSVEILCKNVQEVYNSGLACKQTRVESRDFQGETSTINQDAGERAASPEKRVPSQICKSFDSPRSCTWVKPEDLGVPNSGMRVLGQEQFSFRQAAAARHRLVQSQESPRSVYILLIMCLILCLASPCVKFLLELPFLTTSTPQCMACPR